MIYEVLLKEATLKGNNIPGGCKFFSLRAGAFEKEDKSSFRSKFSLL